MTAALTTSTPSRIDAKLLRKAVEALLKHHNEMKNEKSLLGDESFVHIQFGLDKVPQESSAKPKRVGIPHALWKTSDNDEYDGIQEPTVCLIVKEDSKEWVQELIAAFPKEMGLVKKVLGLDSLRKKHGRFEQQRALLHRFDVFMADDRILPMLGKSLGKHFFATKKQPIPVSLARKTTLPVVILQSLRSTFWFLSEGTCLTVKAGTTGMSTKQIVENVAAVCAHVPTKIPRHWANVRSIAVKTNNSVALPIYNKTPAELKEIAKLAGIEDDEFVKEKPKPVKSEQTNSVTKKRKAAKSPLLKALKKQQELDSIGGNEPEKGEGSSKKKRKVSLDEETTQAKSLSTKKSRVANKNADTSEDARKIVAQDGETPVEEKNVKAAQVSEVTPRDKGVKRGGGDESSSKKKQKIQHGAETPKSKSPAVESTKATTSISKKSPGIESTKASTSSSKKISAVETKKGDANSNKSSPASEIKKSSASANKSPALESKKGDVSSNKTSPASKIKKSSASTIKSPALESKKGEASSGNKSPAADVKKSVASASKKSPAEMKSDVGSSKRGSKLTPKKDAPSSSNETPKKGDAFIPSKKFAGSKSGYVFKSGNKGVGYYVDVKPKVDPMVIEALLRSSTQSRSAGGSGRKAKKSGRGRR